MSTSPEPPQESDKNSQAGTTIERFLRVPINIYPENAPASSEQEMFSAPEEVKVRNEPPLSDKIEIKQGTEPSQEEEAQKRQTEVAHSFISDLYNDIVEESSEDE